MQRVGLRGGGGRGGYALEDGELAKRCKGLGCEVGGWWVAGGGVQAWGR